MAFTCRTEEKHEKSLEEVCKKYDIKTRQKALLMIVEDFQKVADDRDKYYQKMNKLENELSAIKTAIKSKILADEKLSQLVS